jgi:putative FmdB family regulatory protein
MPIYEYECRDCRRVVSLLVLRPSSNPTPACPRCGGVALTRLLSRFVSPKSEDARMEALADSTNFGDLDENDPASVARFMKRMGREMGDDLGDDFEGALDEAMAESESAGGGPADAGESSDAVSSDSAETSDP